MRQKILDRAKIDLMDPGTKNKNATPVFYSSIIFALKTVWTLLVPTAGVDGKNLFINEGWFCPLTAKQRVGLLAHEALHVALRHMDMFLIYGLHVFSEVIEHKLWNKAGDHVINLLLLKAGYELPPNGLWDKRFENMTTVQVYHILHKEYADQPYDLGDPGDLILMPSDGSDKAKKDAADLSAHITDIVLKAAITSKMAGEKPGNIPGEILRLLDAVVNPRLPFEIILANYMTMYAKDDFNWSRPNRRYMPDYILPGAHSEALCNIACAFDVSGSVTEEELSSFGAGIRMISEQLHPEKITLIEFDTAIRGERDITQNTRIMDVKFHGGGGTRIEPVLKWIQKNKPEVTLIFTDGGFTRPSMTVPTDVIWIISNNPNWTAPFGKVFHYQI